MRYTNSISAGFLGAAVASLGLVGCDVKKTQDGDVTLPKYKQTQSGDVTLPKYEVTPPDITVTEKSKVVTVPKVTTEKEVITVPEISIKTGSEKVQERERK